MDVKKIVIKVSINCQKCKTEILKSVTKLGGLEKISVDSEDRLTVVGVIDPVEIVKQLRKSGKFADIVSVGPPEPADVEVSDKEPVICILPPCCNDCQFVVGNPSYYGGGGGACSIL